MHQWHGPTRHRQGVGIEGDGKQPVPQRIHHMARRQIPRVAAAVHHHRPVARPQGLHDDLGVVPATGFGGGRHAEQHGVAVWQELRPIDDFTLLGRDHHLGIATRRGDPENAYRQLL